MEEVQNLVNTKIRHFVVFPETACRLSVWSDGEGIKEGEEGGRGDAGSDSASARGVAKSSSGGRGVRVRESS